MANNAGVTAPPSRGGRSLAALREVLRSKAATGGIWFLLGTLAEKGLLFLSIPLFTHLLTPEEYGIAAIFLTWTVVFRAVNSGNVQSSVMRAQVDHEGGSFAPWFSSVLTLGMGLSVLAWAGTFLLPPEAGALFGIDVAFVRVAALTAVGWAVVMGWLNHWKGEYRFRPYVALTISLMAVQIGLSAWFIASGRQPGAAGRVWGIALPALVVGLLLWGRAVHLGRRLYDRAAWRYAAAFSLPLIPHILSGVILAQFDRVMIARYLHAADAGVYSLAYQFGETVSLLWMVTNGIWAPWFYRQAKAGKHDLIRSRSHLYLAGFAAVTVAMMAVMPLVVRVAAPAEFMGAAAIVPLVMAGGFLQLLYSFYANISFYERRTAWISLGTLLAAGLNIGLNMVWLPRYGFVGAAWSTVVAYAALFLLQAAVVRPRRSWFALYSFRLLAAAGVAAVALAWLLFEWYA